MKPHLQHTIKAGRQSIDVVCANISYLWVDHWNSNQVLHYEGFSVNVLLTLVSMLRMRYLYMPCCICLAVYALLCMSCCVCITVYVLLYIPCCVCLEQYMPCCVLSLCHGEYCLLFFRFTGFKCNRYIIGMRRLLLLSRESRPLTHCLNNMITKISHPTLLNTSRCTILYISWNHSVWFVHHYELNNRISVWTKHCNISHPWSLIYEAGF